MSWLNKPNPEYQAYAVYGLKELEIKGNKLTLDERRIFDYVIDKNNPIQNCSGSIGGLKTPLTDLIKLKN